MLLIQSWIHVIRWFVSFLSSEAAPFMISTRLMIDTNYYDSEQRERTDFMLIVTKQSDDTVMKGVSAKAGNHFLFPFHHLNAAWMFYQIKDTWQNEFKCNLM